MAKAGRGKPEFPVISDRQVSMFHTKYKAAGLSLEPREQHQDMGSPCECWGLLQMPKKNFLSTP